MAPGVAAAEGAGGEAIAAATSLDASAGQATLAGLTPFFKAFCNGTRAAIIAFLMTGEKCVCEITGELGLSQPLTSHHLSILRQAGFVLSRGDGARTYYSIDWDAFESRAAAFAAVVADLRAQDAGTSCACG